MALISNIGLLTANALTGETNYKEPNFNKEPLPNNYEVTALDLIPHPNGDGAFNENGWYIFYASTDMFWLAKQILSPCWIKLVLLLLLKC